MAAIEVTPRMEPSSAARTGAIVLSLLGGLGAAATVALLLVDRSLLVPIGLERPADTMTQSLLGAGAVFLLIGAGLMFARLGMGGAVALIGALFWGAGCISFSEFGWLLAAPLALGFLGALNGMVAHDRHAAETDGRLLKRQDAITRITHWVWAVTMVFMLLSGLQIFNARPNLYIGQESGFQYPNSILDIYAANTSNGPVGRTKLFGQTFDTTGWLGVSGNPANPDFTAFPSWATIPSYRDLGTGRVIHFFFAWILVGTLAIWLINALATGHLWRDIILKPRDIRTLPRDIWDHARLRFHHGKSYTPLQKLAYFVVFVILFPLIILTGLTMSPGMDAAWPWLLDIFGGRQTARTIHFFTMCAFVLFFLVHVIMVVAAGPINELRSMITGYYKTSVPVEPRSGSEDA